MQVDLYSGHKTVMVSFCCVRISFLSSMASDWLERCVFEMVNFYVSCEVEC